MDRARGLAIAAAAAILVVAALGAIGARWDPEPDAMIIAPTARDGAGAPDPIVVPDLPEVPTLPPGTTLSRDHGAEATAEEEAADLGAEMRLLSDARRALRGGEPAVALSLLDQHRSRFPSGALAEEREAYAIVALRAERRTAEAERRLTDFHAEWPESTLLDRVALEE